MAGCRLRTMNAPRVFLFCVLLVFFSACLHSHCISSPLHVLCPCSTLIYRNYLFTWARLGSNTRQLRETWAAPLVNYVRSPAGELRVPWFLPSTSLRMMGCCYTDLCIRLDPPPAPGSLQPMLGALSFSPASAILKYHSRYQT